MNNMTARELALWLADEFHDWIDGDDAVDEYDLEGTTLIVKFDSGATFRIIINELISDG